MPERSVDEEKRSASVETAVVLDTPVVQKEVDFPEGGLQAWSTVFGAFLTQVATFGYINGFGVYQGWIGGAQLLLVFCPGLVTGRLFDRGYFYHLVIGGALLHSFSHFMLSLSHENQYYQVFLSQALGGGLASGMCYIPSLTVSSHFFQRNRPLAMAIVSCGAAFGAVIHPIMLNKFFHSHIGFHNGVRISTAFNSAILLIAVLLMRTRLPPKPAGGHLPILRFFRDPAYAFFVAGGAFAVSGFFYPVFFLQLDATTHGIDVKFAFYTLSVLNAASVIGRISLSAFAPRFGTFNLLVVSIFCLVIILYCHGAVKNLGGFATIAVFVGLFSGSAISLMAPAATYLAKDMTEYGARIGIHFGTAGVMGLFAGPILGALLTSKLHWWWPALFVGSTMAGSFISFSLSRYIVSRRKGTQIL